MAELPIQLTRLPVHPQVGSSSNPVNSSSNATGNVGFKLSVLTPRKPTRHCCLVFRNFYVAWIQIVQVNADGSSTELAAAYPLMQHVHCEDDGQNWQTIKLDELPVSWNPLVLDSLCVYLSQPSPLWETWELREVKLYTLPQESEVASTRLDSPSPSRLEKSSSVGRSGATEDRLTQLLQCRSSRSVLTRSKSMVEAATPVEEQATRCLDMVLRLRELLQN